MSKTNHPTKVIKPLRGLAALGLTDLWRYRELFYFLAWRDIKVRYKQTVFGVGWAVLNPVMQMLVWTFVFGKIAKLPSDGMPYVLVTLSGTLVWSYFSEIVNGAAGSLIANTNLITKIYFPRMIIPLSIALRALLDFFVGVLLLGGMMAWYGKYPAPSIVFLPVFLLAVTLMATGVGLWVAALSVKYRDLAKILPYFIQMVFFITPVAYLRSAIPASYAWVYDLNPLAGTIEGFRWALLGLPFDGGKVLLDLGVCLAVFLSGVFYFRNLERTFADVI